MTTTQLTIDQWEEKYSPVTNHLVFDASWNGTMFETYGNEIEFVRGITDNYVWTWVDGDDGTYIVSGMAFVNRIGYFVTVHPWDSEQLQIQVDTYSNQDLDETLSK